MVASVFFLDRELGIKTRRGANYAEPNASIDTECDTNAEFTLRRMPLVPLTASTIPIAVGQSRQDIESGCQARDTE